jgi:formylglycine-generating enzyme required for sulfatase activity
MTYEHEAQHAETLLYMLAQSLDTEVPGPTPDWEVLASNWGVEDNKVLSIPGSTIALGHDDPEQQDGAKKDWQSHEFGWDQESPSHIVEVKPFKADALPITNQEYRDFLNSSSPFEGKEKKIPASWIEINGEIMVRSFYGPLKFEVAANWPLMASKLEIEAFATSRGGRLPTEAELRLLWENEEGPRVDGENSNIGFRNWHPVTYVLLLFFP